MMKMKLVQIGKFEFYVYLFDNVFFSKLSAVISVWELKSIDADKEYGCGSVVSMFACKGGPELQFLSLKLRPVTGSQDGVAFALCLWQTHVKFHQITL